MLHIDRLKIRMILLLSLGFFLYAICLSISSQAQEIEQESTILDYSCRGSESLCHEFYKVLANIKVQRLLLDVAACPRSKEYLNTALQGTDLTATDLLALDLIRQDGDRYVLAFSLFTREDMDRIRAVAEIEGKYLAESLISKRSSIDKLLAQDLPPGVDLRDLAFFIIGCVSLDWDGLSLAREKGYLTVPGDASYLPEAIQPGGGGSNKALYWGSHNNHSTIAITSFGDHHQVRQGLPDLLWRLEVDAPDDIESNLVSAAGLLIRHRVGLIMLALRDADKNTEQLATVAGVTEREAKELISLLLELNYITRYGEKYRTIIPTLTEKDAPMVTGLRRIGKEVLLKWFSERHDSLSDKLAGLTPVRNGVPLADGFYWIWHYIFSIANRELVAAGLFSDPYDSEREFKGFIPAVYLYDVVKEPL